MKKMNLTLFKVLIFLAISSLLGHAESIKDTVQSFTEMKKYVEKSDPLSTLVVMDNDDTLTMMSCPDRNKPDTCQYLGGPAWFAWQKSQVENMSQPRVANSFSELLTVSATLLSNNYMTYSASDVPVILNELADSGVRLMVETARGNSNISATEQQFLKLNIKSSKSKNLLELISDNSLKFGKNRMSSKASPYLPCGDKSMRPISYQQGLMYISGQDKGVILKCMLDEFNSLDGAKTISNIVFIDDMKQNVLNVHKAFKNSSEYNVYALHYTALKKHKEVFTKGKMADIYQRNATTRFIKFKKMLEETLQNPMLP